MDILIPAAILAGLALTTRKPKSRGIYTNCPLESYGFSKYSAQNIRRYGRAAMKAAAEQGLDPDLLMGQVMVESSWNPAAKSGAGAVGLMQIMPGTAEWISKKTGLPNNRRDPVNNLRMGAWLVRYLNNRWDGDWTLTYAAYLAGSGNVQKALSNTGSIPQKYENYANKVLKWYSKFSEIRESCS